jgi:type II secretory pathway pseudopilin PulG
VARSRRSDGPARAGERGSTLVELVCATALLMVLLSAAVPQATGNLDEARAAAAARHVVTRLRWARLEAASRGATIGFQFERSGAGYRWTPYVDGNGNGVRARDIDSGVDQPLAPAEAVSALYAGAEFGMAPDVPPIGTSAPDGSLDPLRIGHTDIVSVSPTGSETSGTLYLRVGRAQFAVRLLGSTGRTRLLRYARGTRRWISE